MASFSSAMLESGTLAASACGIRKGAGIHWGENVGTPAIADSSAVVQLRWITAHAPKIAAWIGAF